MALLTGCLASFPNSRIKPRSPNTQARTEVINVPSGIAFGTNVTLAAANANRTDLTIKNLSPTETIVYGYVDSAALGDAGAGVDKGFQISPGQSVQILNPGDIYAHNFSDGADALVAIDEGSG